jgi:hypothetical protein
MLLKFKLKRPIFIRTLLLLKTLRESLTRIFIIHLSETITLDNLLGGSEITYTQLLLSKSRNSIKNFMSVKILLFRVLVKLTRSNSNNWLVNILVTYLPKLMEKFLIRNNRFSLHLWCSKETIKFTILLSLLDLLLQAGMIQISLQCSTSEESLDNIGLTSTPELT